MKEELREEGRKKGGSVKKRENRNACFIIDVNVN